MQELSIKSGGGLNFRRGRNLGRVEPRLSGHGNTLKKKKKISLKMGVSAAVTMDTGMFIFCACHIHCCLSIKWVDQGVVYPIRLSGLFSYPAWLRNKGVRIIEVLLYTVP